MCKHARFEPQLEGVFAVSELLLVEDVLLELIPALLQPLGPELTLEELTDLLHLSPLYTLGMQMQEKPPHPMPLPLRQSPWAAVKLKH